MNIKQKSFVTYWVFVICSSIVYASFQMQWPESILPIFIIIPVLALTTLQDLGFYRGYGGKNTTPGVFIEEHPLLKFWLVLCCATVLPVLIYKLYTVPSDQSSAGLYFLALGLLLGPVIIASEYQRFKYLGNQ